MNDRDYMRLALNLALTAKGQTWPNPMVGTVLVKDNRIIAKGYHHYCGGDHAEVIALQKAGAKAKGAKLYVTLEPCSHFGRTPPCVDRIIASGVKEVVVGMTDPNPINHQKSIMKLRQVGIKVKVGFLEKELCKINEPFIKYITAHMPFVVVKSAQTLDGKIATRTGESKWITSEISRKHAHVLRNEFDAILVGINTVLKDNPGLNAARVSKKLKKIIVDSRLRIPLNARLFKNTQPQNIYIATTKKMDQKKWHSLTKKGVTVLICPETKEGVDLKWLFQNLAQREIINILIEGGAHIIGSAFKYGLVDKVLMFISPAIMGDERALGSISGMSTFHLKDLVGLKNISFEKKGDEILVEGYVYRHR